MYNFDEPVIEYIKRYLSYDNSIYDIPPSSFLENKKSMLATSVDVHYVSIISWKLINFHNI